METGQEITGAPYFDIVDVAMPRDDFWADLLRPLGIRLMRKVPQAIWRPGGRERMARDQHDQMALLAHLARGGKQEAFRSLANESGNCLPQDRQNAYPGGNMIQNPGAP